MFNYYGQVSIALILLTIATRMLPFVVSRFMTTRANEIGKLLPSYIMLLLVIYEMDLSTLSSPPYGLPAIISLLFLTGIHRWLENTFISLLTSTTLYILLMTFLFN